MKSRFLLWAGVAVLFPVFCTGVSAADLDSFKGEKGEIRIAGSTAHIPVMKEAARRIMAFNPDIQISIAGGGSGAGIKQVGEGLVDIGNSGRKPTDEEIAKYGLRLFQWAVDGVAVIVNPANKVRALNQEQLIGIFSGKIVSWQEMGGSDEHINVYTRDESSDTREVFWQQALKKTDIAAGANSVVSNSAMKAAVSQDPYAIGYVSVGHMDASVAPVAFDNVMPSMQTVREGKYPIARGLYSNTKEEPTGLTKKFIEYLFSFEGQKIAAENGFSPVQ